MSKYQKIVINNDTLKLIQLIKDFFGKNGGFFSYSLAEGSLDAGDEDRYDLAFHENGFLITFCCGWSFDELIVPVLSPRFLGILKFLKDTDDQLNALTLMPLIQALECAKRQIKEMNPIIDIRIEYRQPT